MRKKKKKKGEEGFFIPAIALLEKAGIKAAKDPAGLRDS